jgi:hypothetical protein
MLDAAADGDDEAGARDSSIAKRASSALTRPSTWPCICRIDWRIASAGRISARVQRAGARVPSSSPNDAIDRRMPAICAANCSNDDCDDISSDNCACASFCSDCTDRERSAHARSW